MRKKDPVMVQQKREHIMRAALRCFAKKGVQFTSTDDICRAAKVSSGTLYYYFKSRDGLLHDLVVHAHATRDHLLENLKDVPNLLDAIINAQYASLKAIEAQGMPFDVYMELLVYGQRNKGLKSAFEEAAERAQALVTEAVEVHQKAGKVPDDLPPASIAIFLTVVASGTSILDLVHQKMTADAYREALAAILYRGLPSQSPAEAKPEIGKVKAQAVSA
ncbi:TetR/AcrR family transcriptional regulator [Sphingosinicella rhizophila]|uniref:TetR/AcrR family transcriptional regulator n=1 Tax=Sphingosinicella rhizophila TaxID=3050082 RepID=A0ABU3QAU6_9SPHN|nr:TetR/AcrR family transcriptional regulator [Sphingosinicella sp. GR2756]MDT9600070.1 TetR/AcrR family transcriptional regulator [Sphingosinicella sp. GR2756]